MGNIRKRQDTGLLFFDFRYRGTRCREYTTLPDTSANRRRMEQVLGHIEAEIILGSLDYSRYFPDSPLGIRFNNSPAPAVPQGVAFSDFAWQWYAENKPRWKRSMAATVEGTLRHHLVPQFGGMALHEITKAGILAYRAALAERPGQGGRKLSPDRINHIMTRLHMILTEAVERFAFPNPWINIKPLKIPKSQVDPFTLAEVRTVITGVRVDFRNYYTVRFFTGLRTGEIDGLKWKYVDFDKRVIHVQETIVAGEEDTPKTQASYRSVQMSSLVYEALQNQLAATGESSDYVFCSRTGATLNHRNVTQRIWYPTLRLLRLKRRRPYQTRHTSATLWLAAGENPEWIARQLGHANTQMLFKTYSRFVPNLTRQDGSAFERLIQSQVSILQPSKETL